MSDCPVFSPIQVPNGLDQFRKPLALVRRLFDNKKMKFVLFLLLTIGLTACTTTPDPVDPPFEDIEVPPALKKPRSSRGGAPKPVLVPPAAVNVDYEGLSRSFGMDPPREALGFKEKSFDTCRVGYGYSASQDCRQNFFAVINFRILCRDSEGTVSVAINPQDLRPLSGRALTWLLNNNTGSLRLDNQGYGQIKITGENSSREERLKISADNDFLYLRAGQVSRIVTPKNWCN